MSNGIKYPTLSLNNGIRHPAVVMREFAGHYGEMYGFTHSTGTDDGIRTFADTGQQDAFRHALVHGLYALDVNQSESRSFSSGGLGVPIWTTPSALEQKFKDFAIPAALRNGFANEFFAANPMNQHLQDLWNNGVGTEVVFDYAKQNYFDYSIMPNDAFSALLAGKSKSHPELFMMSDEDIRATTPQLFKTEFLPTTDDLTLLYRGIPLWRSEGSSPDLLDKLSEVFPEVYGGQSRSLRSDLYPVNSPGEEMLLSIGDWNSNTSSYAGLDCGSFSSSNLDGFIAGDYGFTSSSVSYSDFANWL